jgi:hypothetical protein
MMAMTSFWRAAGAAGWPSTTARHPDEQGNGAERGNKGGHGSNHGTGAHVNSGWSAVGNGLGSGNRIESI